MADRSALLGPFHIISYGSLLGTQLYQTFLAAPIAFRALPRPNFGTLQSKIFPAYFSVQALLPIVVAATYPGTRTATGTWLELGPSGFRGVFEEKTTLIPLAITFAAGLVNILAVRPVVGRIMEERKRQETIDGKKSYDPAPHSAAMTRLNKSFAKIHGISSLLNLTGLIATVYYATVLGRRIE